jgi:hypothetical protein
VQGIVFVCHVKKNATVRGKAGGKNAGKKEAPPKIQEKEGA